MKIINSDDIISKVRSAFISANFNLPLCVSETMAEFAEKSSGAEQKALRRLIENAEIAKKINVPVCQDTGMAVVFVKIGKNIIIEGMNISAAINEGVRLAYIEGGLRLSVVSDPLKRKNSNDNSPAVIHYEFCDGDTLEIECMPKGFGSENMSRIKMMNPTSDRKDIIDFIVETVSIAGSNPCPPVILGIGIGGDFEYAALLSKKALLRDINIPNSDQLYAELESDILCEVNKLNIGAQGFKSLGGNNGVCTCLGVNIETYPTHIASLPVAVNVCCHVMRHEKITF